MTEKEYETVLSEAKHGDAVSIERLKAALKESREENMRLVKVFDRIYNVTIGTDESTWKDGMEYIKDLVAPYMP